MTVDQSRLWLDRAADDLAVAELALRGGFFAHVCFLSHQAFEKSLKAFLLRHRGQYPRTHRLVDLVSQCTDLIPDFSVLVTGATVLDQYYIPTRYPDAVPGSLPMGLPSEAQAREAMSAAQRAFGMARGAISG
jgi:HEPN domain-containing protein